MYVYVCEREGRREGERGKRERSETHKSKGDEDLES